MNIIEKPDIWANKTIGAAASGISNFLSGFGNIYDTVLLKIFNATFRYTDVLYNILRKKCWRTNVSLV